MLQLQGVTAKLTHLNTRTEKMGKTKHRSAADLKFEVIIPNRQLDEIEHGLLHALYKGSDEEGHQDDLTAGEGVPTTLRFPKMKPPTFTEDYPGYFAQLRAGVFRPVAIDVERGTLKGITVEPQTGGSVRLAFSVGCHPEPGEIAELYELMGYEVELDLAPPSLQTLAELRLAAKDKTPNSGGPDDDGDDEGGADDDEASGNDDAPPGASLTEGAAGRAYPDALDGRGDRPRAPRASRPKAGDAAVH